MGHTFVISSVALASWLLCAGCSRHIDAIATRPSPDGAVIAASSTNSGDFVFAGESNEVRLYPRGGRLADGNVVLSYGEDENPPVFQWSGPRALKVQLPCGWWSGLINHYQPPKTSIIIDIAYDAPPAACPKLTTASTALPKPGS